MAYTLQSSCCCMHSGSSSDSGTCDGCGIVVMVIVDNSVGGGSYASGSDNICGAVAVVFVVKI